MLRRIKLFLCGIPTGLLISFSLMLSCFMDNETFESGWTLYKKIWRAAHEDDKYLNPKPPYDRPSV